LRETRLWVDLEPRVATSQTVATPYLREVRTGRGASVLTVREEGLGVRGSRERDGCEARLDASKTRG